MKRCAVMGLVGFAGVFGQPGVFAAEEAGPVVMLVRGEGEWECAPHGGGNVYAPEAMRTGKDGGVLRMWYGAQGRDGHDRILLAESADGVKWDRRGVVLEDATANHCNDPSVVVAGGVFYMYFTRAAAGVTDEIAVATSADGVTWEKRGTALAAGKAGEWDSLLVGRPSVLYEDGVFRMWYDGRKDLPLGAPDETAPKSAESHRHVGYATSRDGIHWERHAGGPVYGHDAGGVQVVRTDGHLVMLAEGHAGTEAARSVDGVRWERIGLLVPRAEVDAEKFGHVTPFLLPDADGKGATLFYGAAGRKSWDGNVVCSRKLTVEQWGRVAGGED